MIFQRKVDFVSPLLLLPISILIHDKGLSYKVPDKQNIRTYLDYIHFPDGVTTIGETKQHNSYIPITKLTRGDSNKREKLESKFVQLLLETVKVIPSKNAIYYPVSEMVTNIFEHSKSKYGWLFAQNYPKKKYFDFCIIDSGRGIRRCYEEELGLKLDDAEAIKRALKGQSAKKLDERGYGIWSSKNVVSKGLNGEFLFFSGRAGLISARGKEKLFTVPDFEWDGVIVACRIPRFTKPVDISPYYE